MRNVINIFLVWLGTIGAFLVSGCREGTRPTGIIEIKGDDTLRLLYVWTRDFMIGKATPTNSNVDACATMVVIYTGEAYYTIRLNEIVCDDGKRVIVPRPKVSDNDIAIRSLDTFDYKAKGMKSTVKDKMTDEKSAAAARKLRAFAEQPKFKQLAEEQAVKVLRDMLGSDKEIIFKED